MSRRRRYRSPFIAAESGRDRRRRHPQTKQLLDQIAAQNFEFKYGHSYERDVSEDAAVGAYIALIDGERLEKARDLARSVRANASHAAVGACRFASHLRSGRSGLPARSTATFISASRLRPFTPNRSLPAS